MKYGYGFIGTALTALLLNSGCLRDPWADVPEFEVVYFETAPTGGSFLTDANFLTWWNILGPLPQTRDTTLHTEQVKEEKILCGNRNAPPGARWRHICAKNGGPDAVPGLINFSPYFRTSPDGRKKSVFYACITLQCDAAYRGLTLNAGSCGKMKVWINGQAVYSYEQGARQLKPDTDRVDNITLRKGFNRIVVKYLDNDGDYVNNRKFCLRFTGAPGNPTRIR